jgi:hypothetical protein
MRWGHRIYVGKIFLRNRAGDEFDFQTPEQRLFGQCLAHFAGAGVADKADRVEIFVRRPREDEDFFISAHVKEILQNHGQQNYWEIRFKNDFAVNDFVKIFL